ncbi:MAG: nicotinate-nucleotide adenylyltransferase [Bacteroidetes bacterium]|nr:nicotinate-nucleotide adenylyltransferase [Bacteroidota bacterium]
MKVGLFFGSFNPIHVGHLIIANHMLEETELEAIWFVVSPHSPHKEKSSLLADHHRLALVQMAIESQPKFKAEDIEFTMTKPSYTIDTLVRLEEKYPLNSFSLIMGEDNIRTFHKWKNYEQIVAKHTIYVYPRKVENGTKEAALTHKNIVFCDNTPMMHLSASEIRKKAGEGKSISFMVTPPVEKYIEEMHFYKK